MYHFCYNKTQFSSLRVIKKEIKIANNKIVRLAGHKTVKLTAYTDKGKQISEITLIKIIYTPVLGVNLLSLWILGTDLRLCYILNKPENPSQIY